MVVGLLAREGWTKRGAPSARRAPRASPRRLAFEVRRAEPRSVARARTFFASWAAFANRQGEFARRQPLQIEKFERDTKSDPSAIAFSVMAIESEVHCVSERQPATHSSAARAIGGAKSDGSIVTLRLVRCQCGSAIRHGDGV